MKLPEYVTLFCRGGVLLTWHKPWCEVTAVPPGSHDYAPDHKAPVVRPTAFFERDWVYFAGLGFELSLTPVNFPLVGPLFR